MARLNKEEIEQAFEELDIEDLPEPGEQLSNISDAVLIANRLDEIGELDWWYINDGQ